MTGTQFGILGQLLVTFQVVTIDQLRAQVRDSTRHDHLTEVACLDVPSGVARPASGCFNIGVITGLHFRQASVFTERQQRPPRVRRESPRSDLLPGRHEAASQLTL